MKVNLTRRDILMGLLFAGLVVTNIAWYSDSQIQNEATARAWEQQQRQLSNLQRCYEQDINPCTIQYN